MSNNKNADVDVLNQAAQMLKSKKKSYIKILAVTFVLSCLIILPQPRYYACEVKLAPEYGSSSPAEGIGSLAASFGFDLSNMQSSDAIYPLLYPELFESPEFLVPLFDVRVNSVDGELCTNYHDYLKNHQKKNPLVAPFVKGFGKIKKLFESDKDYGAVKAGSSIDPFRMSRKDYNLMKKITNKVKCAVNKKNNVVSIVVEDQDPLICATMADSVRAHLQSFIINYRTSKARQDVAYSIELIENDMGMMLTKYQTMSGQLENAKAKVQEQTPAFTVIKSPTVPIRPAGPKRMIFVAFMLILATFCTTMWYLRRLILSELI